MRSVTTIWKGYDEQEYEKDRNQRDEKKGDRNWEEKEELRLKRQRQFKSIFSSAF